jgi:hypothetical protein
MLTGIWERAHNTRTRKTRQLIAHVTNASTVNTSGKYLIIIVSYDGGLRHFNDHTAVIELDWKGADLKLFPTLPQVNYLLSALCQNDAEYGVITSSTCVNH